MPLLYHGNSLRSRITSIASPSWWRQKLSKFNSNNNDDTKKTTSSTGTTRDWRSLSPNKPPLPFVLDHDPTVSNLNPLISQSSERAPKVIKRKKKGGGHYLSFMGYFILPYILYTIIPHNYIHLPFTFLPFLPTYINITFFMLHSPSLYMVTLLR
ncbi:hypothetical protein BC941DRAFT_425769 [Chlamydoabsidia padenii]|nr:hypothetical protein BC941DRAFT_425769 [Chlamydoabsidia padenii]